MQGLVSLKAILLPKCFPTHRAAIGLLSCMNHLMSSHTGNTLKRLSAHTTAVFGGSDSLFMMVRFQGVNRAEGLSTHRTGDRKLSLMNREVRFQGVYATQNLPAYNASMPGLSRLLSLMQPEHPLLDKALTAQFAFVRFLAGVS